MIDKTQAKEQIAAIVAQFRDDPKRNSYNEQQTREYFVLPLFRALGWATDNPAEFTAEEQISRGFADFGFYLNGVPVFYLETKRVAERIQNPEFIKQAINYAYLRGVTWAVLTDFEQLLVFNAEWETRDLDKARFLSLEWEHYANGQFDDLWLLSKPAMQDHEIDKVAERYGKKTKKEPVTKVLFAQLTEWRKALFSEMSYRSDNLWAQDPRNVDNAVQRLIDRLIFVRTMEDRGVETQLLKALLRQSEPGTMFPNLLTLFRELDTTYNSNLFATHPLDMMEFYDPDLLAGIIEGLYRVKGGYASYDFNAISADVLGAVYEQYLGFKAQDPAGKKAIDLRKQKKRKTQGIFYTPQFVVRYIVQQTLGQLLENGADPLSIRVLDPACGSGSFLIEAFDVLDRWIAQQEPDIPARVRRERILKENIYGVDLDEQAVEVTRLNLLLRAAYERQLLPMLTNIKHGNSLIDDPDVVGETAFNWERRFPDVFAEGGFDVVIGNPPYVDIKTLPSIVVDYIFSSFPTANNRINLFAAFIERALSIIKPSVSRFSMIIPTSLLTQESYRELRNQVLE